jgi:hypothetical protein
MDVGGGLALHPAEESSSRTGMKPLIKHHDSQE